MEESKRKAAPSVPANYVSILELQERWNIEKERKQKQNEEEGREKQQVEEEQKIEEDLKKSEVKGTRRKRIHREHWRKNRKVKKSVDGGEAEKEEPAAIESVGGEDAAPRNEGLPEKKRGFGKRYKNQDVAPVVGSIAPPPAIESVGGRDEGSPEKERKLWKRYESRNQYVAVEEDVVVCASIINTPVRVKRKNGKKTKGKKSAENPEKATAIETQFENLSIKSEETKTITRSSVEEPAAIGSVGGEGLPKKKRGFRKRYNNKKKKKKKNQDMALVEDVVGCAGSIATENNLLVKDDSKKKNQDVAVEEDVARSIPPPPEYNVTENKFPVKDEIRVYRKKEEKTKGNGNVEKAAMYEMAIKTQFENLSIETKNLKASSNRNPPNHLPPRRVRMPIVDGTMVWVKKEKKS